MQDYHIRGGDLTAGGVPNIHTVEECRKQCEKTDGCSTFTYVKATKTCHPKTTGVKEETTGYVSGRVDCPGTLI